ncbi:hypothetical protein Taro_054907 [Colocasia esculenta]|uniref:Uncharacterized protein n=1 Tax=Colocasia esculenta TaxID=4460 RepID=A0A843XRS3_COLES|nr:hypothetical protein [Colocasia esculenta]
MGSRLQWSGPPETTGQMPAVVEEAGVIPVDGEGRRGEEGEHCVGSPAWVIACPVAFPLCGGDFGDRLVQGRKIAAHGGAFSFSRFRSLSLKETSAWTVAPFIRDSFSMIGSAVGGTASAFYGFNYDCINMGRPDICKIHQALNLAPPVIVFSSACAGLAGGGIPALAQLTSSSYHAAFSSSTLGSPSQDDKMHKSRSSSPL